jgi:hypothetical protein
MTMPPQQPPPPWGSWYEGNPRAWWNENPRRPPTGPDYRVSDAERNALADLLSKHYGDGRLDDEEFKARMDRTMSAKTQSDLAGLTTDLPRLDSEGQLPDRQSRHPHRRHSPLSGLGFVLGVVLTVSFVSWSVSSVFFAPHVAWLLVLIVGLLLWRRHSWRSWHRHHHRSHPTPPPF